MSFWKAAANLLCAHTAYNININYEEIVTAPLLGRTPFYAVSVNGLHRDRVRDRVSVGACRLDSSGNLLTQRKMEFAPGNPAV